MTARDISRRVSALEAVVDRPAWRCHVLKIPMDLSKAEQAHWSAAERAKIPANDTCVFISFIRGLDQ